MKLDLIEVDVVGNALYLTDTKTGTEYRVGGIKGRHPEKSVITKKVEADICPLCGKNIIDESTGQAFKFCPGCGVKIYLNTQTNNEGG